MGDHSEVTLQTASPNILFGPICVILNIYVSINISNTELIENCSGRIERVSFVHCHLGWMEKSSL